MRYGTETASLLAPKIWDILPKIWDILPKISDILPKIWDILPKDIKDYESLNFIEITLRDECSPVNLLHILRTPFLKNTSGCLLVISYLQKFLEQFIDGMALEQKTVAKILSVIIDEKHRKPIMTHYPPKALKA